MKRHALAAACLWLAPATARAAGFDATTGKVVLEGAALSIGFEEELVPESLELFARRSMPLDAEGIAAHLIEDASAAIEGSRVLELGGDATSGRIRFDRVADLDQLAGRRVRISFWQRAFGFKATMTLSWAAGSIDSQDSTTLGTLAFQPTGRATDDGWEEWTSGPVDFSLAGMLPPATLGFRGGFGGFRRGGDSTSRVWIDAIMVEDLGPAAVPFVECTLATEATACGVAGECAFGRCVDAATRAGPVLENADLRRDYLRRRAFEFAHLEGGRIPLSRMGAFERALVALAAETSPVKFWNGLAAAVQTLGDGHASPPRTGGTARLSAGVCLHLGEADLIEGGGTAPLVFSTSTSSVGAMLRRGDALVAVDGRPVAEWRGLAARFFGTTGDAAATELTQTPDLMPAAIASGATLRFARPACTQTSTTRVTPCAAGEVRAIEIALGRMSRGIWRGEVPDWLSAQQVQCDFRFRAAFPSPQGAVYDFAGATDEDGVRTLQINGVPSPQGSRGAAWFETVQSALTPPPSKMILDQRLGDGGTIEAVDHLAGFLVGRDDFDRMDLLPRTVQPVDEELLRGLRSCAGEGIDACGDYIEWKLGENHLYHGAARSTRLAVLIGLDVSGNDFLTRLLTFRDPAVTRIFGGAPTIGAFGVIWTLPLAPGETSNGSIQVQDTIFRRSGMDTNVAFQTTVGVVPDQVVLEKQSDAVRGVDTLVEAAKVWLAR